jgi:predicted MFS family arabinose efflux permease
VHRVRRKGLRWARPARADRDNSAQPALKIGPPSQPFWRATLAGLSATLVGIGLARFAYTPLIPALIAAGWFTPSEAVYLGAANLAGYLAGALLARALATRLSAAPVLRTMMMLATAAFFACAAPLSFLWFFIWRVAAGLAGGVLMALAAPSLLPMVPAVRRGLAGGIIFTGVGLGIAASGTLVPLLLDAGLAATWCGLGAIALCLTLLTWTAWPRAGPAAAAGKLAAQALPRWHNASLAALYLEYALNAAGLVPHMVFLVDFVARGLGRGLAAGAGYWILFGVGALCGPVLAGRIADRVGFRRALRGALLIQIAMVATPSMATGTASLIASSVLIGALVPGVVPLVLGRIHELIADGDPLRRARAWSYATTAFAAGQAVGAYGLSFLYSRTNSYPLLFGIGSAALVLALAIDLAFAREPTSRGDETAAGV